MARRVVPLTCGEPARRGDAGTGRVMAEAAKRADIVGVDLDPPNPAVHLPPVAAG